MIAKMCRVRKGRNPEKVPNKLRSSGAFFVNLSLQDWGADHLEERH